MQNIQIKNRQSNIELLRIISIFLILVTHADFWALGEPSSAELINNSLSSFSRIFFESLSIICINIFVLISGWFSIRATFKGVAKLLFQVYFVLLLIYLVYILFGWDTINFRSLSKCFIVGHEFWFIKAYLGLFILSPVLNAFVNTVSEKVLRYVLIAFFTFQTIYGWVTPGAWFLHYGYSITSFAGLYLLARYVKLYMIERPLEVKWGGKINNNRRVVYFLVFCGLTLFNAIIYIIGYYLPYIGLHLRTMAFAISSPLVILQSLSLLLFFSKLEIKHSPIINFVAASSFSVFILQSSQDATLYSHIINHIYSNFEGLICLAFIFSVIVAYFVVGVFIDQIRKLFWSWIDPRLPDLKLFE